ncbi:MAG: hypothetical protein WDW38_011094 [Sanguina aurantia]
MVKGKGGVGKRCTHSSHKHKKYNKQLLRAEFEQRHIDQVWEDVRKPTTDVINSASGPKGTTARSVLDEDVPGYGKFYCVPCSRYFQSQVAHDDHDKTRPHKRRLKLLTTTARPHNQQDADIASGMGAADNGPRLRSAAPAAAAAAAAAVMEVA